MCYLTEWSLCFEGESDRGRERSGFREGDKVASGEGERHCLVQLNTHLLLLLVHRGILPQGDLGTPNVT